jgi:peptidoglycan/LPS O-acetylase OafA/YrhL
MSQKFPPLDGLRALSIVFVLAGHLLPIGPKSWQLNESVAALGMTTFFSLSGFLIATQLLRDDNVGRFLIRRASRILPLAFAYTFFVYAILQLEPAKLIFTNLFLVNYFHQYLDGDNGHLWSLCVEVHFYIAIAISVALLGRRALWLVWPVCIVITLIRVRSGAEISIVTHLRVDEILIGACLATVQPTIQRLSRFGMVFFLLSLILTFLSCWPFTGEMQYARPYFTAVLFIAALQSRGILCEFLCSRPLRYIAQVSYALYVIHPITTHGWLQGANVFDKYLFKRPISVALSVALAHFSTFYWERPWIKYARSITTSSSSPVKEAAHSHTSHPLSCETASASRNITKPVPEA